MAVKKFNLNCDFPTQFNIAQCLLQLGFGVVHCAGEASFNDRNLQLHKACEKLEYKHLLAELCQQNFPEMMPPTFYIDRWCFKETLKMLSNNLGRVWVLKPSLLNNGEGIKIFTLLEAIKAHFESPGHFDGPHVLQQYITKPHLLNGHKYSFRMFVVITNYSGAYLYPQGYFNVCHDVYKGYNFDSLGCHLTNEHLEGFGECNSIQIPTTQCQNFDKIYSQMRESVMRVLRAFRLSSPDVFSFEEFKAFSIFGFDFMLDKNLKLWLLEINHGPCFPKQENHPLQEYLYNDFWQAVLNQFVMPIAGFALSPTVFEKIRF